VEEWDISAEVVGIVSLVLLLISKGIVDLRALLVPY
jgi:hypothetical protein